jgi:hypothetical protein
MAMIAQKRDQRMRISPLSNHWIDAHCIASHYCKYTCVIIGANFDVTILV